MKKKLADRENLVKATDQIFNFQQGLALQSFDISGLSNRYLKSLQLKWKTFLIEILSFPG